MTWSDEVHNNRYQAAIARATAERKWRKRGLPVPVMETAQTGPLLAMVAVTSGLIAWQHWATPLRAALAQHPLVQQFRSLIFGPASSAPLSVPSKSASSKGIVASKVSARKPPVVVPTPAQAAAAAAEARLAAVPSPQPQASTSASEAAESENPSSSGGTGAGAAATTAAGPCWNATLEHHLKVLQALGHISLGAVENIGLQPGYSLNAMLKYISSSIFNCVMTPDTTSYNQATVQAMLEAAKAEEGGGSGSGHGGCGIVRMRRTMPHHNRLQLKRPQPPSSTGQTGCRMWVPAPEPHNWVQGLKLHVGPWGPHIIQQGNVHHVSQQGRMYVQHKATQMGSTGPTLPSNIGAQVLDLLAATTAFQGFVHGAPLRGQVLEHGLHFSIFPTTCLLKP
ncbi:hypothetical protein VOLCADRAFT_103199 [Volvox carteri f. nagariensis]|uniref:Uncharacterized protein n=1 Tax=Volvox carteri f. nagariensis TaxID=3068 RepID=D8TK44_VOLCA|nr:uncharacterized protein VOLCADRAFT_103199 [Volvox carteri f. nagariensis]EFJ52182.1 hypothetical protein VOLCADRAFT_103199 [Volvox carteri f. nagariensis]|eukprot:XP_002946956.1 hypothetical protein VOLCADRAFT_103199 [Volvox carteri f. nagariensis]